MQGASSIKIRPAEDGDHDGLQQLWSAAGLTQTAPDEWTALMTAATSVVLVAEGERETIGAAIATYDGWRAYIYHVAVHEKHRRGGVAHRLMESAEQYLIGAGARHVYVMVHQENTEGLALVGSVGYVPEGEIVLVIRLATRVA
jgi:ribosomal protein S18 acetylase RimI-like enzyme